MLREPPVTSADLRFSIAGIPVRVHPFFWLVSLVFGATSDSTPGEVLMWVGVVFVSILIHELGHAVTARAYRSESWIVLYSFGGLAMHAPPVRDWRRRIAVMAAGPLAGFAFAAVLALGILAAGERVQFEWSPPFGIGWRTSFDEPWLRLLFSMLFFVNIYWGLVNLLPVFPLDGGQIARALFLQFGGGEALRQSLWLSMLTAAGFVAYILMNRPDSLFLPLFFGYLAYLSYQELQDYGGGGWR
jgi:Zn-dependent protease